MNHSAATGLICPSCRVNLIMSDRQGIEIDYCPQCRGVWLDRGELDKIIERSANYSPPPPSAPPRHEARDSRYDDRRDYGRPYDESHYRKRRPKSFFEELFD